MRIKGRFQSALFLPGCVVVFALISAAAAAQTSGSNAWTWMGGSNAANQSGVYGKLGAASSANAPGARWYASKWTDANGNLWLFGGDGFDSLGQENNLNDLWEFNPSMNQWTWMGGNSTLPCTSFGQCGEYAGVYGILGTPATGNQPGSRSAATSWSDNSGNLWLFGGDGIDSVGLPNGGWLNDLWKYNPAANQWVWVAGSNTLTCVWQLGGYCGAPGQYSGSAGTYTKGNIPTGRFGGMGWKDLGGNLWLFGGMTMVEVGVDTYLNDLWEYNLDSNQWIWMGGSPATPCPVGVACSGPSGVYGTLGNPSAGNTPGAREFSASWTDASGNLWLFGGQGMVSGGGNYLNDLWMFNPSTSQWTWMGGSNSLQTKGGSPGVYGTLGTPAPGNNPGSRQYASSWTDAGGNLWLFGGYGFDANGSIGNLNDLWVYNPFKNEWAWMSGSSTAGSSGTYGAAGMNAANSASAAGMESPGAAGDEVAVPLGTNGSVGTPPSRMDASSWTDKSGNLWLFGGSRSSSAFLNDVWEYQPTSVPFPARDFSLAASPASFTVASGHSIATSISVTPANGFGSTVSFSCSGLPAGVSCSFSPQTVTPTGAAISTMLTISASASAANVQHGSGNDGSSGKSIPTEALAALVFCFACGRRFRIQVFLLLLVGLVGMSLMNGCGGGASGTGGGGTQGVGSTITINATSGSLQHSTAIQITVD